MCHSAEIQKRMGKEEKFPCWELRHVLDFRYSLGEGRGENAAEKTRAQPGCLTGSNGNSPLEKEKGKG